MTIDHKILYDTEHISREYAGRDYLDPAEKALIKELGTSLSEMDMLDMGVGGGRTTKYFAPLVKSYIGADYSPLMLNECRKKYPKGYSFIECDVRKMQVFEDDSFDFILFSYNGIDSFSHKDRISALKEIKRVLRDGGILFFSSHNLGWERLLEIFTIKKSKTKKIFTLLSFLKIVRLNVLNRSFDMKNRINKLREKNRGHIYDNSLNGKAGVYYITQNEQVRQLRGLGFKDIVTYCCEGIQTTNQDLLNRGGWIYYFCRTSTKRER